MVIVTELSTIRDKNSEYLLNSSGSSITTRKNGNYSGKDIIFDSNQANDNGGAAFVS